MPILTSFTRSRDEASSDKDVSDATLSARTTFSVVIFFSGSVRRDKREVLSLNQKWLLPPLSSHGHLVHHILSHFNNSLIHSLSNSILLWSKGYSKLM